MPQASHGWLRRGQKVEPDDEVETPEELTDHPATPIFKVVIQ